MGNKASKTKSHSPPPSPTNISSATTDRSSASTGRNLPSTGRSSPPIPIKTENSNTRGKKPSRIHKLDLKRCENCYKQYRGEGKSFHSLGFCSGECQNSFFPEGMSDSQKYNYVKKIQIRKNMDVDSSEDEEDQSPGKPIPGFPVSLAYNNDKPPTKSQGGGKTRKRKLRRKKRKKSRIKKKRTKKRRKRKTRRKKRRKKN